jgi:hypothetical protein
MAVTMEIEELFSKLRPALGKRIDALWVEYQLNPRSRNEIEGLLNVLAMQHLGYRPGVATPVLVPPDRARPKNIGDVDCDKKIHYAGNSSERPKSLFLAVPTLG